MSPCLSFQTISSLSLSFWQRFSYMSIRLLALIAWSHSLHMSFVYTTHALICSHHTTTFHLWRLMTGPVCLCSAITAHAIPSHWPPDLPSAISFFFLFLFFDTIPVCSCVSLVGRYQISLLFRSTAMCVPRITCLGNGSQNGRHSISVSKVIGLFRQPFLNKFSFRLYSIKSWYRFRDDVIHAFTNIIKMMMITGMLSFLVVSFFVCFIFYVDFLWSWAVLRSASPFSYPCIFNRILTPSFI